MVRATDGGDDGDRRWLLAAAVPPASSIDPGTGTPNWSPPTTAGESVQYFGVYNQGAEIEVDVYDSSLLADPNDHFSIRVPNCDTDSTDQLLDTTSADIPFDARTSAGYAFRRHTVRHRLHAPHFQGPPVPDSVRARVCVCVPRGRCTPDLPLITDGRA